MKTYKKIDLWISCILISVFSFLSFIRMDETFIIGYFTVGAWHVISMLVHAVNGWFTEKGSSRRSYHWTVLIIFILTIIGFAGLYIVLMAVAFIMLFAAPVMAICYTLMCYDEIYVKMRRPIELLK